jgi:hypothetical protein
MSEDEDLKYRYVKGTANSNSIKKINDSKNFKTLFPIIEF